MIFSEVSMATPLDPKQVGPVLSAWRVEQSAERYLKLNKRIQGQVLQYHISKK
jgi:hypothetical protein